MHRLDNADLNEMKLTSNELNKIKRLVSYGDQMYLKKPETVLALRNGIQRCFDIYNDSLGLSMGQVIAP